MHCKGLLFGISGSSSYLMFGMLGWEITPRVLQSTHWFLIMHLAMSPAQMSYHKLPLMENIYNSSILSTLIFLYYNFLKIIGRGMNSDTSCEVTPIILVFSNLFPHETSISSIFFFFLLYMIIVHERCA